MMPTIAIIQLGEDGTQFPTVEETTSTFFVRVESKSQLATSLTKVPHSSLSTIDIQVPAARIVDLLDPMAVASLTFPLQANGAMKISLLPPSDGTINTSIVATAFLLSGLTAESEVRETTGKIVFTALKKVSQSNGVAPQRINLSFQQRNATNQESGRIVINNLDDNDEDDMVDEDALLEDDAGGLLSPPDMTARTVGDDCGGRKACDNCSCGRAEKESGKSSSQNKMVTTSSCGNCAKGDAFRCASCPFLGKPAFKPGEEHLILDLQDDI